MVRVVQMMLRADRYDMVLSLDQQEWGVNKADQLAFYRVMGTIIKEMVQEVRYI